MLYILFLVSTLANSGPVFSYLSEGLQIWFNQMIPALFPAILWNNMVISSGAAKKISKYLYPLSGRFFSVSLSGAYAILAGFLCGFPLGAKVVCDLYQRKQLSRKEADYLLGFCNLIGPVYVVSFLCRNKTFRSPLLLFILLYGIPFLYGHALAKTKHRKGEYAFQKGLKKIEPKSKEASHNTGDFFTQLDESIKNTINALVTLGGYMITFQLLRLFLLPVQKEQASLLAPFLELNTGLLQYWSNVPSLNYRDAQILFSVGNVFSERGVLSLISVICLFFRSNYFTVTVLTFTGLCCHAQACHYIKAAGLSCRSYLYHKCILTLLTFFVCVFCFCLQIPL